jgi:hypothetical protein
MPDDFDLDAYFNRIADELGEVLDKVFDLEPPVPAAAVFAKIAGPRATGP